MDFPAPVLVAASTEQAQKSANPINSNVRRKAQPTTEIRIIYLQGKEFCLFPEGADQSGPAAHAAQSAARVSAELSEVLRTEVGQLVLLPVRPEILDRV